MIYLNQLDYPYMLYHTNTDDPTDISRKNGTVRKSGCGLCSSVMVADRLLTDYSFTLTDAIHLSYDTGANHAIGTDYKIYAPAFAEKLGFKLEMTSDPERVLYCLHTGGAVVAHVSGNREGYTGVFSTGGHYIAVISADDNGRVAVLDPSYKEGKYDIEGRAGKVDVKGVVCYCDISVLVEDTKNRTPSFYLFWKK